MREMRVGRVYLLADLKGYRFLQFMDSLALAISIAISSHQRPLYEG
ncbi:hypothetical protein EV14_1930 [Prochlorococcus sp. MIT 0703]|nr:hypothetical protein EV12_0881 [Prochlorococcus sp. MIT 0701]KGG32789.1 hypothetical protein EV14_1930 [Prochlorococcus sp. MIT 0703]